MATGDVVRVVVVLEAVVRVLVDMRRVVVVVVWEEMEEEEEEEVETTACLLLTDAFVVAAALHDGLVDLAAEEDALLFVGTEDDIEEGAAEVLDAAATTRQCGRVEADVAATGAEKSSMAKQSATRRDAPGTTISGCLERGEGGCDGKEVKVR